MDLRGRQDTNRGFGDAMSRSFELALVPAVFGGLGWLIDQAVGTSPSFFIGLLAFGVVGIMVKFWVGYDLEMKRHEAEGIWNRKAPEDAT